MSISSFALKLQPADPALMPDQPTDAPVQADDVDEFGLPVAAAS